MLENEYELNPEDISIRTFNNPESSWVQDNGVEITHIPTGRRFISSIERSQHRNRAIAMDALRRALEQDKAFNSVIRNPVEEEATTRIKNFKGFNKVQFDRDVMELVKAFIIDQGFIKEPDAYMVKKAISIVELVYSELEKYHADTTA